MTINLNHVANQVTTTGSNTNIPLVFQSKGTGAIDLAAGSSGVNISNGGTVTAITRTGQGSGYTSLPTVTISAPTTAGGVQATATCTITILNWTLSGGTGYTVGDTVTLSGGTFTQAFSATVATLGASNSIASLTVVASGNYTAFPASPASLTGGTGTGATMSSISGGITASGLTITNAGSGYVEQPTVSFSGGGGSGAAAYASVGGGAVLKALNTFNIGTNSGTHLQLLDGGLTNVNFLRVQGGASVYVGAAGSDTNVQSIFYSRGTGNVTFATGSGSTYQLNVAHTASAVNYVQVTGAATAASPVISFQGSDTNISADINLKGSGSLSFRSYNGSNRQFRIEGSQASVNYVQVTGNTAGSAPAVSSQGTDTNIDLTLTTKGTGSVNLNTGNGTQFKVNNTYGAAGTAVNYFSVYGRQSGSAPIFAAEGTDSSIGPIFAAKAGNILFRTADITGGNQFVISHTASAVNYVQVTGAATSGVPVISAQGSDSSIAMLYQAKGGNAHRFWSSATTEQFRINHTASSVNYATVAGSAAGSAVTFSVAGTDTNIDLALTPKGTGNVMFGTYTGTALSIAGYIEIKDAGGTVRKLAVVA